MSTFSAQKATSAALIAGYNAWNIDAMLAPRAPQCVQQVLPATLGLKPHDNAQYRKYFEEQLSRMFTDFKTTLLKEIHDPEARQSVLHLHDTAQSPIGPYANEYMFVLSFTEDGTKIIKIEEFLDSANCNEFFGRIEKWLAEQKA